MYDSGLSLLLPLPRLRREVLLRHKQYVNLVWCMFITLLRSSEPVILMDADITGKGEPRLVLGSDAPQGEPQINKVQGNVTLLKPYDIQQFAKCLGFRAASRVFPVLRMGSPRLAPEHVARHTVAKRCDSCRFLALSFDRDCSH